jgi:predicted hotdog family 3-hydroxylacyl-ACP dehydratase
MTPWPIADVVPHAGAMILLDSIDAVESERIVCTRTIEPGCLFVDDDGGMPSWMGVELMAQAIAAWDGCCAHVEQRPVRLGFLLGTRHYACNVDTFPVGTCLRVEAKHEFSDAQGMGVFHCRIEGPDICAEARLNVFSPPDAHAFFRSNSKETPHG